MEPEPRAWQVLYFQRETGEAPAKDFLASLPEAVKSRFMRILSEVASAPPPSYGPSRYWQAMHDEMSGFYEVRVRSGKLNHRLFCLLDRTGLDLGGRSVVCLGGFSKNLRTAAHPREYRRLRRYRDEFRKTRAVVR